MNIDVFAGTFILALASASHISGSTCLFQNSACLSEGLGALNHLSFIGLIFLVVLSKLDIFFDLFMNFRELGRYSISFCINF